MATKFEQVLKNSKVDARRLIAASTLVERERAAQAPQVAEGGTPKKPRKRLRGRPITQRLVDSALAGKVISGPAKTRLLRAVNHVLAQKKQAPLDLRAMF